MTLDHLSNGRLVLPVGLGALSDGGFDKVGEVTDRKSRAQMLDESLTILDGLWSGEPFSFKGEHYHLDQMTFRPTPAQSPRIPVWVVAAWPSTASMRRALRCDGAMPIMRNENGEFTKLPSPAELQKITRYVAKERDSSTSFDVILEGSTPGDDSERARTIVKPFADAGATWWLEAVYDEPAGFEGMRKRILQGPPKID